MWIIGVTNSTKNKKYIYIFVFLCICNQMCRLSFSWRVLMGLLHVAEQKEEKDGIKTDDCGKLQNGENGKEGGTAASAVNISEEKKKASKQRFMFNIADGGFTGGCTFLPLFFSISCLSLWPFCPSSQSFTPCGRMKRGPPPSPRRLMRYGTVAMITGCWLESYSIL